MTAKKSFFQAGASYFIGNIFDKALAFITVPIFTRMLSSSDYGIASTYLSFVAILSVFITLSLGNSMRTAVLDFKSDINKYLSSIFSLGIISATVISSVFILGSYTFTISFSRKLVVLCCLHAYSASIIATIQWKYIVELKYLRHTFLQCIPNISIVVLSIILIMNLKTDKYFGKIFSYFIINFVLGVSFVIYYLFQGKVFFNLQYWKYGLCFSLPLIFHSLSNTILSQSDRTMISYYINTSEAGLYSLAVQFGLVPTVVVSSLESLWIPFFMKQMELHDYKKIIFFVRPYIYFVTISCICIILIAPDILKIMSDPSYHSSVYFIAPIVLATFFRFLSSIPIDHEYYSKQTKQIATSTIFVAMINIVLNFMFIPQYGALAASYTTVVSYFSYFLIHFFVSHKLSPGLFHFKYFIIPILFVLLFSFSSKYLISFRSIRFSLFFVVTIISFVCYFRFFSRNNLFPSWLTKILSK